MMGSDRYMKISKKNKGLNYKTFPQNLSRETTFASFPVEIYYAFQ